jgi:diketogulonate reductase-like aldo/keto reductase
MPTNATPAVPDRSIALSSGVDMPLLGFGTWQLKGEEATRATADALELGYRHLDTATVYRNEREVGVGLSQSGLGRDQVFVTTKVLPDAGPPLDRLQESLDLLDTDFVDLWLIHAPPDEGVGAGLWRSLASAREDGLAANIGVSNYSLDQIDELIEQTGITPAVNQIEWSPLLFDQAVLDGHREREVVLEGYSALRGGTLQHPVVGEIADRLGRTPAQVIIRWHLEHDVVVIPKSRDRSRIKANADVDDFVLSPEDVAALDGLGAAR